MHFPVVMHFLCGVYRRIPAVYLTPGKLTKFKGVSGTEEINNVDGNKRAS